MWRCEVRDLLAVQRVPTLQAAPTLTMTGAAHGARLTKGEAASSRMATWRARGTCTAPSPPRHPRLPGRPSSHPPPPPPLTFTLGWSMSARRPLHRGAPSVAARTCGWATAGVTSTRVRTAMCPSAATTAAIAPPTRPHHPCRRPRPARAPLRGWAMGCATRRLAVILRTATSMEATARRPHPHHPA